MSDSSVNKPDKSPEVSAASSSVPAKREDGGGIALPDGWRGDEHQLAVSAVESAGLDPRKAELDLFQKAFAATTVVDDPEDHAIVLRGRTTLDDLELMRCLRPTLRFLKLNKNNLAARVHDGEFEIRVDAVAADYAPVSTQYAKTALQVFMGAGLVGWAAMQVAQWAAAVIWGVGLLLGAWLLRRGLVSGRALLAARLATSLAMLAQEERLILPLAGAGAPGELGPGRT